LLTTDSLIMPSIVTSCAGNSDLARRINYYLMSTIRILPRDTI
jgi:hypothetical protein